MSNDLKEVIKSIVRDLLDEMSTTGAVSGYQTPFAFSRKGVKNLATKNSEKMGFTVTKDISENDVDDKINTVTIKEDVSYNVGKDMLSLKQGVTTTEESIRKKFVDSLRQKFLGKNLQFQGSKGYGQFKTSYSIKVKDVSIEDWYNKDDYQLILTGDDDKRYFVDISMPIKIVSAPVVNPPSKDVAVGSSPKSVPTTIPAVPTQPLTPLSKQINK